MINLFAHNAERYAYDRVQSRYDIITCNISAIGFAILVITKFAAII
jgi:hypothetical protein